MTEIMVNGAISYVSIAKGAFLLLCCVFLGGFGISGIYRLANPHNNQSKQLTNERASAFIIASALIVGWAAGVYGTILLLPALRDLTTADRQLIERLKDDGVLPEPKDEKIVSLPAR